jgi:hypothetical protein
MHARKAIIHGVFLASMILFTLGERMQRHDERLVARRGGDVDEAFEQVDGRDAREAAGELHLQGVGVGR